MSAVTSVTACVMDNGKPAAGDDHPRGGVGCARRSVRPHHRVFITDSHARVLSRRDNDADAEDADPSSDYLLHHHRSEGQGAAEYRTLLSFMRRGRLLSGARGG